MDHRYSLDKGVHSWAKALGDIPMAGKFIKPVGIAAADLTGSALETSGNLASAEIKATRNLAKKGFRMKKRAHSKKHKRRRSRRGKTRRKRKSSTRKGGRRSHRNRRRSRHNRRRRK